MFSGLELYPRWVPLCLCHQFVHGGKKINASFKSLKEKTLSFWANDWGSYLKANMNFMFRVINAMINMLTVTKISFKSGNIL